MKNIIPVGWMKWVFLILILFYISSAIYLHKSNLQNIEDKKIVVTGTIATLPEVSANQTKFNFSVEKINNTKNKKLIHLSWYHAPSNIAVGDEWKLVVKLKKIHSLMNLGGFDYETWAFQEGIHANGYVFPHEKNQFIQHHIWLYPFKTLRAAMASNIDKALKPSLTSPWIKALVMGERSNISQSSWEVLRNTGTNHLMAIAGLHIGFVSGFFFFLIKFLWKRSYRLTCYCPAEKVAAVFSLLIVFLYSALAGFSLPTQRACIMVSVFLLSFLTNRKLTGWIACYIAILIILFIHPLSLLSDSFWLSFGAVALIIYGIGGRLRQTKIMHLVKIQYVLAIGLLPFSIVFFQQFSFVSLLANTISIPWVGFIILPLALMGSGLLWINQTLGALCLSIADANLSLLWRILSFLAKQNYAVWYHAVPNHWIVLLACIGIIFLLLPRGVPGRLCGAVWLMPLIFYHPQKLSTGDVNFFMLDVGQGLSAVVQTQHHILIYDTGAKLSENFDMGESVVTPFLRAIQIKNIDLLMISHGDNDHVGGAQAVLNHFKVKKILTSEPDIFDKKLAAEYCLAGNQWQWDGVNFEVMYPSNTMLGLDNDSSCVLKVSSKKFSILLTGDIEKAAEKYLLTYNKNQLPSTVMVAPHHGSKTSGNMGFINAVHPAYILFPVGYHNRYHFPHAEVVKRYRDINSAAYNSVDQGEIKIYFDNLQNKVSIFSYRNLEYLDKK